MARLVSVTESAVQDDARGTLLDIVIEHLGEQVKIERVLDVDDSEEALEDAFYEAQTDNS